MTSYREHAVWDVMSDSIATLEAIPETERTPAVSEVLEVLRFAKRSKSSSARLEPYRDLLDTIQQTLPYMSPAYIANGSYASQLSALRSYARALPTPPPRELSASYQEAITDAARTAGQFLDNARENFETDLQAAQQVARDLGGEIDRLEERLAAANSRWEEDAKASAQEAGDAKALIEKTADEAERTFKDRWDEELTEWKKRAENAEREHTAAFNVELATLATAAQVGQRLLEHAAGTLTAHSWTQRASRERRSGNRMRATAVLGLLSAVVVGYLFTREALGSSLSIGQSTLRISVVGALTGLGAYLMTESRRHFREADSAEEVSTVIEQMEPFLAGSEFREDVRRQVGDTVFVRNVVSRFAQRDGGTEIAKQLTETDMTTVLTELTAAVQELNKARKTPTGS